MAAKKSVKLFYDVVSPYSWIGFEVLMRYKTKWNMNLLLKPFFLGGIMDSTGNRPPMMQPQKAIYMFHDLSRLRDHYQIPLKEQKDPFKTMVTVGTLQAMRFVTAVDMKHPELTEDLSRALWMRVWNRDEDISQPESFIQAGKDAGLNEDVIKDALQRMKEQPVKDRLKEVTAEALAYNAFGAPTIVAEVNGEEHMIFGSDRFPILADILGEKYVGPLTELAKSKL